MKEAKKDIDKLVNHVAPAILIPELALILPDKHWIWILILGLLGLLSGIFFCVKLIYYCRKYGLSLKGLFTLYIS